MASLILENFFLCMYNCIYSAAILVLAGDGAVLLMK